MSSITSSLRKRTVSPGFWMLKKDDLKVFAISILVNAYYLVYFHRKNALYSLFLFDDSPSYQIKALSLENRISSHLKTMIPSDNLYSRLLSLIQHTFNWNLVYTLIMCSFLFSLSSLYLFRRLLVMFNISNPTIITIASCFVPISTIMYRVTPTFDSLFSSLLYFSFICFGMDMFSFELITIILIVYCHVEGIAVAVAYIVLHILQKRPLRSSAILSASLIFYFVFFSFNKPSQYVSGLFLVHQSSSSISLKIFKHFFAISDSISNLRTIHSIFYVYGPLLFGGASLVSTCFPMSVFVFVWLLFLVFINGDSIIRIAIPAQVFAYLIGLPHMFTSIVGKYGLIVFSIIYFPSAIVYNKTYLSTYDNMHSYWWRALYSNN